jgi:hypothetical protein
MLDVGVVCDGIIIIIIGIIVVVVGQNSCNALFFNVVDCILM